MKTVILSPQSVKSSTTTTMEENQSCYYPGCRKDANCSCDICLDSINATLDLMPMSVQKSSLTRLSASKPFFEKTPVSIDPTLLSTPVSRTPRNPIRSPTHTPLRSTAETGCCGIGVVMKRKMGYGLMFLRWVLLFGLIFGLEYGFSWGVVRVLRPRLSREIVRDVAEKSLNVKSLSERLMLIQQGLMGYVDGPVSSCNLGDSSWKINQDGLILNSQCILYHSAAEEVSVWGWPLHTDGLLTAGCSRRSFTVLSGRVREWPEGKISDQVRETNSTWVQRKWSASVIQFDTNTWIVEYKQNMFVEKPSISVAAVEFLKFRISRFMGRMQRQFWLLPDLRNNHGTASLSQTGLNIPT